MAASRTACGELRLSCTLAHPSRFRARARTGALGLSAPSSCFHMDHELMALPEVDDVLKSSHLLLREAARCIGDDNVSLVVYSHLEMHRHHFALRGEELVCAREAKDGCGFISGQ